MPALLAIILTASQIGVAADSVPKFDVEGTCRPVATMAALPGRDAPACRRDERVRAHQRDLGILDHGLRPYPLHEDHDRGDHRNDGSIQLEGGLTAAGHGGGDAAHPEIRDGGSRGGGGHHGPELGAPRYTLAGRPTDLRDLLTQGYRSGARIHVLAWGSAAAGTYDIDAYEADLYLREHPDATILVAAQET